MDPQPIVYIPKSDTKAHGAARPCLLNVLWIFRDEQRKRPLLGDREGLSNLRAEYQDGSQVFIAKINSLVKRYQHFRRTRQDGNCFYRCFLFSILESLLTERNQAGAAKLIEVVQGWKRKLIDTGYQELVFEDALDLFVEFLKQVGNLEVRHSCKFFSVSWVFCPLALISISGLSALLASQRTSLSQISVHRLY
jgi:hypothetical protein